MEVLVNNMLDENKNCWLVNTCNHIDCDGFCLRRFKLDYLYNEALISYTQRQYIPLRLDKDEKDKDEFIYLSSIEKNILKFIENGDNLYIHSDNTGNGKTSWALRLVQAYFNKIWPYANLECKALFISVPKFLLELKSNISDKSDYIEHIKDNILKADIVIWDDIATKSSTVFEAENLFTLIDSRINLNKCNIYTSNLNEEEIHQALGDRLYSRIVNYSSNIYLQ